MRNSTDVIKIGNEKILLTGVDDPTQHSESLGEREIIEEAIKKSLEGIEKEGTFKILLSHRPEMLSLYSQYEFDVVFSGHAHGGQVRIPFVGGLVAPNQGLFPKYTSGKYTLDKTTMIVNRGLGNSIIPFRIFNLPEIVVLTLYKDAA